MRLRRPHSLCAKRFCGTKRKSCPARPTSKASTELKACSSACRASWARAASNRSLRLNCRRKKKPRWKNPPPPCANWSRFCRCSSSPASFSSRTSAGPRRAKRIPSYKERRLLRGRFRRRCRGGRGHNPCGKNRVELRKITQDVRASLVGELALIRTVVPIAAIERIHHRHAFDDFPEWRKAHAVKARIIHKIDENLCRPRVRPGHRVRDVAAQIRFLHRIIFDVRMGPRASDARIGGQSELDDEVRHHAKEAGIVVKMMLYEIVEAIRTQRRPRACDLHHKIAFRGVEANVKNRRRCRVQRCRIQK